MQLENKKFCLEENTEAELNINNLLEKLKKQTFSFVEDYKEICVCAEVLEIVTEGCAKIREFYTDKEMNVYFISGEQPIKKGSVGYFKGKLFFYSKNNNQPPELMMTLKKDGGKFLPNQSPFPSVTCLDELLKQYFEGVKSLISEAISDKVHIYGKVMKIKPTKSGYSFANIRVLGTNREIELKYTQGQYPFLENGHCGKFSGRLDIHLSGMHFNNSKMSLLLKLEEFVRCEKYEKVIERQQKAYPSQQPRVYVIGSSCGIRDVQAQFSNAENEKGIKIDAQYMEPNMRDIASICKVIKDIQKNGEQKYNIILLVRGGSDGLGTFDDSELVKTIERCRIFIVTGIGHAESRTDAERAAGKETITPTAAADFVIVKEIEKLNEQRFKKLNRSNEQQIAKLEESHAKDKKKIRNVWIMVACATIIVNFFFM
ncbi:TPA: exodeoxyribonuclease VII large subunit [Bacillus tropicus]